MTQHVSPVLAALGRVVELNHELYPGVPTYPGQPPLETEVIRTNDEHGFQLTRLHLNTHHGTHVDAPSHFVSGTNQTLSDFAGAQLVGRGVVLDVPAGPGEGVTAEQCAAALAARGCRLPDNPIILLHTGFQDRHGLDAEVHGTRHPYVTSDAAEWLVAHNAKIVGIDATSFERHGGEIPDTTPAHNTLLGAGVLLIEEVAGLDQVTWPDPLIVVAPLPLRGADGAPCRVFAIEI
jgi:kynurenine formamidase